MSDLDEDGFLSADPAAQGRPASAGARPEDEGSQTCVTGLIEALLKASDEPALAKFSSKRSETEESEQTEVDDSGAESPPQVSQPPASKQMEQTPRSEDLVGEKPASPAGGKIRAVNEMKLNSQEMESQTTPATQMKAQPSAETPTTAKQDEDMKLAESQLPQPENSNLLTDSGSLCDEQKPPCLEPGTSPRSLAPSSHSEETKLK